MSTTSTPIPDSPIVPLKHFRNFTVSATSEKFSLPLLIKTSGDDIFTRQLSLWPEEEQALENIQTGKTRMIIQSGEDFLKELDELVNGS